MALLSLVATWGVPHLGNVPEGVLEGLTVGTWYILDWKADFIFLILVGIMFFLDVCGPKF